MSHYGIYKTKIKYANSEIAQRAVELLAQKYGTAAQSTIKTFYKNEKVLAGFNCEQIPYGIGVRIEHNKLVIVGDSYRSEHFDIVRKEIEDRYQAICFSQALNTLGYSVEATENKETKELILVPTGGD